MGRYDPGELTPERAAAMGPVSPPEGPLPERLSEAGLYLPGTLQLDPQVVEYVPQYPLWTDGASKRRWIRLPAGQAVDARDPAHFRFPIGTRLFKEFSFEGRTETRYIELTSAGPRYAAYVWNAEDNDATLAPEAGVRGARELGDGVRHDIPSRADCALCHEGGRDVVLGFDALSLSGDRDPLGAEAPPDGGVDLAELVRRGVIVNLPAALLARPPRAPGRTPLERAARGYLSANCGHCHNGSGPLAPLGLDLAIELGAEPAGPQALGIERPSKYLLPGDDRSLRIARGDAQRSVLAVRMRSRAPAARMPPLGTRLVDERAVALVERWINEDLGSSR